MRVPMTFGAILTLGLAAACGGGTAATPTPPPAVATPTPPAAATPTAPPAATPTAPPAATPTPGAAAIVCSATGEGGSVTIEGFSFDPSSATVATGGFLTFTNRDGTNHTVTFDGGPNCGAVAGGQSQTIQFTVAGTYPYHCAIHPTMVGTVEVN